ncbi:sulfate ABC transporter ATP-binding protein [Kocuria dechangensis]|uniref:Sulfate ABC transporter ATP-binding protein n=1 Tax=Kocuria dechangensis TaxID=1176249 RepID=A0A917LPL4_9MICC|nr:ABC transporter ATP-binding protein [Kocuria dechangensis]GGG48335.1 sulfate ABC transporter ATP-binding protein [Kocuria dechangensis]
MAPTLSLRLRHQVLDVDLSLPLEADAPVTVLFGPSGAGKTTLLRCVAGLDAPAPPARVVLDGEVWNEGRRRVNARRRGIGYLFQDHALFPHMGVDANVAYGLTGLPRAERRARTAQALADAGVAHLAGRATRGLSGGEAQRVALARALAVRPRLLLLDEPLSALDAPTRTGLRAGLRAVLASSGTPTLLVTHDRAEALALGDRLVVLVDGRVHQQGPVQEVFSRPATPEVARAVGTENVLSGRVESRAGGLVRVGVAAGALVAPDPGGLVPGGRVLACVRAEDVALETEAARAASPRNRVAATVTAIVPEGPLERVELDAGFPLTAYVTRTSRHELGLVPGSRVRAVVKAAAVHLIPRT